MTARPLPPCPVCGEKPMRGQSFYNRFTRSCWMKREDGTRTHELTVYGSTEAEADELWRRVAEGRK